MRWIAGASLACAMVFLTVAPSLAIPTITVTANEVISTVPPRYKTTFKLELVGYNPIAAWYGIQLTSSGLGPAVNFYGMECPSYPWSCSSTVAMAAAYKDGGGLTGPPTQFSVVTDQLIPCVKIRIPDMLLAKAPTPRLQNDYVITACLAADMPTPTSPSTWGFVKAIYR